MARADSIVLVNTGHGKGKSSAAFGVMGRGLARGWRVGVVLDADSTLRFPDLRAEERTFALVAQLAGRSGRGPRGGRVIVQALEPEARSLRHAAAHDADGFVSGELERRRLLRYPPFGHLIRIVCSSEGPEPQARAAEALLTLLAPLEGSALGPAPLFRLKGRERVSSSLIRPPLPASPRSSSCGSSGRGSAEPPT